MMADSATRKKHLLLIAYYYPPDSNGGVERPLSLSDYLPEYGYDVTVLTAGHLKRATCEKAVHFIPSSKNWKQGGLLSLQFLLRVLAEIISRVAFCPLTDIYWQLEAKKYFKEKLQNEQFDLVYASFPTHDVLFLAESIRKIINVPLVVECRDGIGYEPLMKSIAIHPLVKHFSGKVEKWVMTRCSLLVVIGNNMGDYYRQTYPATKVAVIPNGFREETVNKLITTGSRDNPYQIKVAHFGSLGMSRKRKIWPLFKAISDLKKNGTISAENFNLSFWGRFTPYEKYLVWQYGVGDLVKLCKQQNKIAGLQTIVDEFDFVLLYGVPGEKTVVTSKLYDYFLVKKPIIGICAGNEAEQIINQSGLGEVCGFDSEEIKAILMRAVKREIRFSPNDEYIKRYDRRIETRQLAMELDSLFSSSSRQLRS